MASEKAMRERAKTWVPEIIFAESLPFSHSLPTHGLEPREAPMAHFANLKAILLSQIAQLDR